jgi:hypothetical protein
MKRPRAVAGDVPLSAQRATAPRVTSRYVVEEQLASGGMGVVYRVTDRVTGEPRALKRIHMDAENVAFMTDAFEREYRVLASLDHPRIIRVFDYGVDDLGPYYTMELLEGADLRQSQPMSYRQACLYLRDIATSLLLLHARRLVHRDLSATNVRTTGDGHCKLLDFGALAAFGRSDVLVGTPPAVPPEAVAGTPLDQRADLYSLGALAYWMLTGTHAYPARAMNQLPELWKVPPRPPSALNPEVPRELDNLVLGLLSEDPLARPGSAAEVIARLSVIGHLPPEDPGEIERLALSFLRSPPFVGRTAELTELEQHVDRALSGAGGAIRIEAAPGMGRSRLLEELGVRAQLVGAAVVRVDASMHRQVHGTTRAIVLRLLDALPEATRKHVRGFRAALSALGIEIQSRLTRTSVPEGADLATDMVGSLEEWFVELSTDHPLVISVDNVEYADDRSLGLLAALARACADRPLLLVLSEATRREGRVTAGQQALRSHSTCIELTAFSATDSLALVRSLFGDAPHTTRFADWLHGRTAGSPLHAIEISRQLIAQGVVRYSAGVWTLPDRRPDAELPVALGDALGLRLRGLGQRARSLAECLSLQLEKPTWELCRLLAAPADDRELEGMLEELTSADVLYPDRDGYRFSSTALREALLEGMDSLRLQENHTRLGQAFEALAQDEGPAVRLQAGWHFIRGGEDARGAELIASVTHDAVTIRTLIANLHRAGAQVEAALDVYARHRRSVYERMPLLAALAQAGYYEDRSWGVRYGDAALDVIEDISGLRTARRLGRVLGRWLGLVLGILIALLRFKMTPVRERPYSFAQVLVQLFGTVTTLAGTASLTFDIDRTARIADILEPFSVLPERLTPVGIYEFCRMLQEIGRDNQSFTYERADTLLRRFEDPRYYPTLPAEARTLYVAGAHFTRGSFAIFRADGRGALESADALDRVGLKLYAMIASQLRTLYYMNRGEFAKAAPHREQVELHAAHVGSAWQVEMWEAAALVLVYTSVLDVVASTQIAHQLDALARDVPSMRRHARLAQHGLLLARRDRSYATLVAGEYAKDVPRSYIGWAATLGYLARGHNELGQHVEAKAVCEAALAHVTDADREYVSHFLGLDLQLAIADAALGDVDGGLRRVDGLIERFAGTSHPLLHGMLHDARARITWRAGRVAEYERSLAEVERWFRPTGTGALLALSEDLARLRAGSLAPGRAPSAAEPAAPPGTNAAYDAEIEVATETVLEPTAFPRA